MIVIGLTGSIGMGKSTTARMFAELGIPVADADAIVHRLYENEAVEPIETAFPGTTGPGGVDREALSRVVLNDRGALKRLEAIVHPLVRGAQDAFVKEHRRQGARMVVLDIPLLFETGGRERVDKIVVVSCPPDVQRDRVLARPGMSEEKFAAILARQTPDDEKRRQADFVVETGQGMEQARRAVSRIVTELGGA